MKRSSPASKLNAKIRTDNLFQPEKQQKQFRERMARMASNGGDSNIRVELQRKIIKYINEGKKESQILELLKKEEKYDKYKDFFESWINHQMDRYKRQQEGTDYCRIDW